ncbi:MAG: DUF192 domain-containing protein [Elusimicrobia bacterium]|nr:DUF192 domain-containing protein [Elusimicrobiota bacterium]
MIVFNRTKKLQIAARVIKADSFQSRLFGLIPRKSMAPEEGLWLEPCAMIHTCFMSFPIDAVFLGADLKALKICPELKPWRFSPWVRGAKSVLELAPGRLSGLLEEGDLLEFR